MTEASEGAETVFTDADEQFMRRALVLADKAQALGEVPVGAVLVNGDEIIAEGYNQPISGCDPTAHAEIMALRDGAKALDNYRLTGTTLYITIEPCPMCAGAIIHSRVSRVVFGACEPRAGAAGSAFELLGSDKVNHRPQVESGLLAEESSQLLKSFFKSRR